MQQISLFWWDLGYVKKFERENIFASFRDIWEWLYEVYLEINSNKFLIHFTAVMKSIENLEVVAIKWFVELSVSIIKVLKKIIYKLYFEI